MGRGGEGGRGTKGRGNKSGRGSGRKMFIANEDELNMRNLQITEQIEATQRRRNGEDDEEGEEGGEEGGGEEEAGDSVFAFDRPTKAADPSSSVAEEEEEKPRGLLGMARGGTNNPNVGKKATEKQGIKIKDLGSAGAGGDADEPMSRREREAVEAEKKKEDYLRRHRAGETEEAKKDLARLAAIRKKREEDASKRAVEGRAPGWTANGVDSSDDDSDDSSDDGKGASSAQAKAKVSVQPVVSSEKEAIAAKKKAAAAAVVDDSADAETPKLKAMDIKKMNGDALKDALKARGLGIQGSKADLAKRLTDHEAVRA